MDFSWTEQQIELKEKVISFAQEELQEEVSNSPWEEKFNRKDWIKCSDFGVLGWIISQEYGGSGWDILTTVCALEALGYAYCDNGLLFSLNAHIWACEIPLLYFGNEEQKKQYLPKLCRGEFIGAHAVSEPQAGSDVYSMKTTAQRKGDQYLLNGTKIFVTNAPVADLFIVFANVDPSKGKQGITAFLIEKESTGLTIKSKMSKMGNRTAMMGELSFFNCEVSAANRLGQEGAGVVVFNHTMEWERGFILASAVGTMERILQKCIKYARSRQQFGQPIGKFQQISSKIAELKVGLEASRALLYKVAWLKQTGKSALMEAAMAKLYISESWVQLCLDAIQIHGGYGYLTEFELERELRDALGSRIYSGTSEIQRQIIAQLMGL